jgi:hypothetical protein
MNGVFEIGCLRDIPEPGRSASVLRAGDTAGHRDGEEFRAT